MKMKHNPDGSLVITKEVIKEAYPEVVAELEREIADAAYQKGLREGEARAQLHLVHKEDNPPRSHASAGTGIVPETAAPAMTREQRIISDWKNSIALQREFGGNFHSYLAYTEANEAGLIKIYGN